MSSLRQILARREEIRAEMAALNANANTDGSLPGEAEARWNALAAEADALHKQEQRQALLDDMARRAAGTPAGGGADNRFDALAGQVTVLDRIRAQLGATDAGAGHAPEVSAELARRSGRSPEGCSSTWAPAAARSSVAPSRPRRRLAALART